jgi:ABC-type lipoprotein release transport system permease subunit
MARSTAREAFNMIVLAIFGCSALILAAIGIYGLLAYSVAQASREIGIRVALGVNARDPLVFAAVPLVLVAVALAASWLPAMRAARIDHIHALHYE